MFDRVFVIGAGGTGSYLLEPLARLLCYRAEGVPLDIIDGDKFEDSNLTRQAFDREGLGVKKSEYFAHKLTANFGPIFKAWPFYISNNREGSRFIRYDTVLTGCKVPLVIVCSDNDYTRYESLEYLAENYENFFWISPGNGLDKGQVITHIRQDGADVTCDPRETFSNIGSPYDGIAITRTDCNGQAITYPQLIIANMLAAALTLNIVTNILDKKWLSEVLYFDTASLKTKATEVFVL